MTVELGIAIALGTNIAAIGVAWGRINQRVVSVQDTNAVLAEKVTELEEEKGLTAVSMARLEDKVDQLTQAVERINSFLVRKFDMTP